MAKPSPKTEVETDLLHPKHTAHLVGHSAIEQQLLKLYNSNRLPHALLLTGKKGIGKAGFAYRLARFLLTDQDKDASLFGDALPPASMDTSPEHPTFRKTVSGSHPDLLVIEGEEIKIEKAREIPEFLSMTPAEGEWRVVIIDAAEAMNRNASNALLKTLEEPPAKAILLLVSHNPGALLPTIRSRCRVLKFSSLTETEFAQVMKTAAPQMPLQDYPAWALLSGYSPGVALELAAGGADKLYQELLEIIAARDTVRLHAFADKFARKEALRQWELLKRLALWLISRLASGTAELHGEVFSGERQKITLLRASKTAWFWTDVWERANSLFNETDNLHLDKKQAVLSVVRIFQA